MGSSLNGTGVTFSDGSTKSSNNVNVQTFNSTAAWTKPTGYSMCRIQIWGGGGGAARSTNAAYTGGGGGGAYNEVTVPLSYINSQTVTVGAGGAGATGTGNGSQGGVSSVVLATAWNGQTTWAAYGGGGGYGPTTGDNAYVGGGGGGQLSAGTVGGPSVAYINNNGLPNITGGGRLDPAGSGQTYQGGQNNSNKNGCYPNSAAPASYMHGGAGGNSAFGGACGSIWGGGGGFGGGNTNYGSSVYGGSGGTTSGAAGVAPAGGGSTSTANNGNGGSGAAGRIIITCW